MKISKELAKFAGWPEEELHSRTDVTKYICNYIKENGLQGDKNEIKLDNKLRKLLGPHPRKDLDKPLRWCDIQTGLKDQNHFPKS